MTPASTKRISRIVSDFIRSPFMEAREFGASSDDWISDPERMERCDAAAAGGGDGSTHAEHIADFRAAWSDFLWYSRRGGRSDLDLVDAGVQAHFDSLELWHEQNGSLYQQVG